ncbi:MAG: hemerythrin family protein [Rhodospirillales bacterium]|nr:hemerythrin family protein [Rhodospirillales bacterium]
MLTPVPAAAVSPESDPADVERRAAALALVAQDHRRLAVRWEALIMAIEVEDDAAIVRDCIVSLISCARDHFVNEEWAMRTLAAPEYLTHKAEHVRLLRDAGDMLKNFDAAFTPADWTAVAAFFRHWICSHHSRWDDALFARLPVPTGGAAPAA